MAAPLPVAPAARPLWGRVLVGCALVGGLLILAGIGSCIFGMYWLTTPGRQVATGAVASDESQGVIRVGDLAADPGARALMTAWFQRMQEAGSAHQPVQLPAWIRNLQAQQARQGISQWLPREATISLEPDAERVTRVALAVNLRGFVQPIRLAFTQASKGDPKTRVRSHGDHEIVGLAGGGAICFLGGTLVVAHHPDAMPAILDRLQAAGPPKHPAAESSLPGIWDVNGRLEGDTAAGLLALLLQPSDEDDESSEAEALPIDGLRDLRFGIDIESADDARISMELAFASAEAAAAAQPRLAEGVARLRSRADAKGLTAAVTDSLDGDRMRYQIAVGGLAAAFGRFAEAHEPGRRQRTDP